VDGRDRAYAKFQHDKLATVAADHPELKETSLFSSGICIEVTCTEDGSTKGLETTRACPEAYGVYSVMANWNALAFNGLEHPVHSMCLGSASGKDWNARRFARFDESLRGSQNGQLPDSSESGEGRR